MDREAAKKKLQAMKGKARKARGEGKKEIAKSFRAAARRVQRKLKATAPKGGAAKSAS